MKKRNLTALLALTLLMSSFAGCANDTQNPADTTTKETSGTVTETEGEIEMETETEAETEAVDPADILELPETNWDGKEFCVLGQSYAGRPQFENIEINVEEITGEGVNDAVYNRNRSLEAKYGVVITQDLIEGGGANAGTLRTAATAGEDRYNLACIESAYIGALAAENMLYDLNNIEYINFSKNWWNPVSNESLSIANKLFFTTSDFLLRDKSRINIIIYNKDMVKNNNLTAPMDLVRSNQWTLEKFFGMAEQMGSDLDGNGAVDSTDQFGFIGHSADVLFSFVAGSGSTLISKNEEDTPILNDQERIVGILDTIMPYWANQRTVTIDEDWNGKVDYDYWSVHTNEFYRGGALFVSSTPNSLSLFSAEASCDYGVLPYPKYNEEQDRYYANGDKKTQLLCIPTSAKESDFCGFMLEALSEASTDTSLRAFIELSCKGKYVYDEDSAEMLDLLFDSIIYDQATTFGIAGVNDKLPNYAKTREHNLASDYARMGKVVTKSIEKLVEKIQNIG